VLSKDMTDEQIEARELRRVIEVRIRRLRLLIDQIEAQTATALDDAENGRGRYSRVAESFAKELAEGVVNVGMDQLINAASTVDVCRAQTATKQKSEG
jgi:hypothetical protein